MHYSEKSNLYNTACLTLILTLTLTLTLGNTRKPSIAGKPLDAAVNSIVVATAAFSYGSP